MIKRILNKLGIKRLYKRTINGKLFHIPVYDGMGFGNLDLAEPWMANVLQKFGSNDAKFLDVGVNIGQTLLQWKSQFPNSEYVGFEPNEKCIKYVSDLIALNKLSNCDLFNCAIGESSRKAQLFLLENDQVDSTASTIKDFRKNESRNAIDIEIKSLEDLGVHAFDLVKIDVEGSELEVLKSVFKVNNKAIIFCEILPVYSAENVDRLKRQQEIELLLKKHDFEIYRIIKAPNLGFQKLEEIGIHGELSLCDYLFLPKEKANHLKEHL